MTEFKVGDKANFLANGSEIEVVVYGVSPNSDAVFVETVKDRRVFEVQRRELLRVKGPFFDIRGLVFTTSVNHPGEQGEIVKRGKGPDNTGFFCVQFPDRSTEWLKEHEVCIEGEPSSPAHS
jgi:hypothetical protein